MINEFEGNIFKQGGSHVVVIPANIMKEYNLSLGHQIKLKLEVPLKYICKCGKIYQENKKANHKCFYIKLSTPSDVIAVQSLIEEIKKNGK